MKIAIIGYGKMGHMVEQCALDRGHVVTCRIDADNLGDFDSEAFRSSDVAIEFTTPATAVDNFRRSFRAGVPVVAGTTGWLEHLDEVERLAAECRVGFLHSSNFSIGVNLFRVLNRFLTRLMQDFPQYRPAMTEVHHVHKLDHPSGTAITLANDLLACDAQLTGWAEPDPQGSVAPGLLPIAHERRGEVPGIHTVTWDSPADLISITHSAKSRIGFASGAVMAAEWLAGRQGVYTMDDMLRPLIEKFQ